MDAERENAIVQAAIAGGTVREIAAIANTSRMTVSRRLQDRGIRAIIDQCSHSMIVSGARKAVANVLDVVHRYHEYRKAGDKDRQALSLKYSAKIAESMGVLASPTPSVFVQQIFNQQTNNFGSEASSGILDKLIGPSNSSSDTNIIDYDEPDNEP